MSETRLLVCIYWPMHCPVCVPSVKVRCSRCPSEVAMDKKNLGVAGFAPVCPECFLGMSDMETGGFLIVTETIDPELDRRMVEHMRSVVRRWKRSQAILGN